MTKNRIELKREYWSQPDKYFTPAMVEALVSKCGDKPATTGEAAFVLDYHVKELVDILSRRFRKTPSSRRRKSK